MAFKSGKNGRLSLNNGGGATAYKIKRWSVTPKNQIQDVTNGESGGYGQYIAGVSDLDFSCDLDALHPWTRHHGHLLRGRGCGSELEHQRHR
jgi:hypothetical protein